MARPRKDVNADTQPETSNDSNQRKVVRRDMVKRREQNRQSQKTYREKKRRRLEELERLASASTSTSAAAAPDGTTATTTTTPAASNGISQASSYDLAPPTSGPQQPALDDDIDQVIDPSVLEIPTTTDLATPPSNDLITSLHNEYHHWLHAPYAGLLSPLVGSSSSQNHSHSHSRDHNHNFSYTYNVTTNIFFDCGCPSLHILMPPSDSILPIRPPNPYRNTLRLDIWCVLAACLENCLHLGIPKAMFCGDEAESLFYRPGESDDESSQLVASVRSMSQRSIKHDLRPLEVQITRSHHPYIDVLPFQDLRRNIIAMMDQMDEDEFLHDFFNHVTCWGGAAGAGGQGMPWDGRNWEASEEFLGKWASVIGGDDGELTRHSRWWRSMRGERIEEVA